MATPTLPEDPHRTVSGEPPAQERVEARLARLERLTERGAREGRNAGRAFMIFAVAALLIAIVNLVVVTEKVDKSTTAGQTSRPAATTSEPAAAAPQPAAPGRISVALREYTITPSSTVGRAGRVSFAVRNDGAINHEFVVLRTAKPAADLLKGAEADEAGNVGEIGDVAPGQTKTLALPLKAGHYALICNLPGHYTAGQHADFTVR